jgi:hypothetical protein
VSKRQLVTISLVASLLLALVISACSPATPTGPVLKSIANTTPVVMVKAGDTNQLIITATFVDGTTQNVTAKCTFATDNAQIATVSAGGLITAIKAGQANISVSYIGGYVSSQVFVPVGVA